MASKSTKGSSLMSSSGTMGTLVNTNKSSLGSAGTSSSPMLPIRANLAHLPVIEEELQVEEGCDNEFESHRVTLQKIRQATQTWTDEKPVHDKNKNATITESELRAAQRNSADLKDLGCSDRNLFAHLEEGSQ